MSKLDITNIDTDAHGPQAAYYASNGVRYVPTIDCLCGWTSSSSAWDWEEVGGEFDEHLEDNEI